MWLNEPISTTLQRRRRGEYLEEDLLEEESGKGSLLGYEKGLSETVVDDENEEEERRSKKEAEDEDKERIEEGREWFSLDVSSVFLFALFSLFKETNFRLIRTIRLELD